MRIVHVEQKNDEADLGKKVRQNRGSKVAHPLMGTLMYAAWSSVSTVSFAPSFGRCSAATCGKGRNGMSPGQNNME